MNAKFSLAIIALVGIGVFALPSTMALFAGQHSFYNIDATGNQIPCQKCHGDVKAELSGGSAKTGSNAPHATFECEYCHRAEKGRAAGDDAYVKSIYADNSYVLITVESNYEAGNYPSTWNHTLQIATGTCGAGASAYACSGIDLWGWQNGDKNLSNKTSTGYNGLMVENATVPTGDKKPGRFALVPLRDATTGNPIGTAINGAAFNPKLVIPTWDPDGIGDNMNGTGANVVTPGTTYHAASLVSCMECHAGSTPALHHFGIKDGACPDCHYGSVPHTPEFENTLAAGGFGVTTWQNDTGAVEAHTPWVTTQGVSRFGTNSKGIKTFSGKNASVNNDACIACHTHVAVDINFQKGYKLSFDATESKTGVYTVSNAAVEGTVNISVFGNQSGATYAVGDQAITWNSGTPMYVNGQGTPAVLNLNNEASDNASALTSP